MPKNNSDISKDVEHIRNTEQLERQIRELETRLYRADREVAAYAVDNDALRKINAKLQSDNSQLLEQYDQLAAKCQAKPSQCELDACRELNEALRRENEKLRGEK